METNNTKRRALGRGLEDLFNSEPLDYSKVEEKILTETPTDEIVMVNIDELRSNPYQPRKVFDEEALLELSQSIKEHGVFQPIIIKKSIKGYEIIAGERRVKASKMAGLNEIPAIIRDFSDNEKMEIALLENLQREDLNAIEEATAYKKLQETLGLTQEALAERLGKSRSHITNMLGLLTLPAEVRQAVGEKKISMAHARVISKLENREQQLDLTERIINEDLSVRQLENLTSAEEKYTRTHAVKRRPQVNSEYTYLEEELSERLGTKVKIKNKKIEITFVNSNDLNRLLEIMNLESRR